MDALKNEPTFIPQSYTTMDDLFIPEPPFSYQVPFEDYRILPVILKFNRVKDIEYEESTYIYIKPFVSSKVEKLDDIAIMWQNKINRDSNSLIQIITKDFVKLEGVNVYELIYNVIGYDDNREKGSRYIERVYFIPVDDKQVAAIRLVRNINDDSQQADFWRDWLLFLKSIRVGTPAIASSNVEGKTANTRHYFVRNMNFDIPLGDSTQLNLWSIGQNAERTDNWNTPSGKIRVKYHIADGYEDTQQSQNDLFKDNAQAWGNQGAEILMSLLSKDKVDYEYHEVPFGLDDTIYGTSEIRSTTTGMEFNVSYKYGKSIEVSFYGDNKTMADNKNFILEWLGQFRVIK